MSLRLRPTAVSDLAFVTGLERDAENRDFIGQWTDNEHLAAIRGERARLHRVIELDGIRAGYVITYVGGAHSPSTYV